MKIALVISLTFLAFSLLKVKEQQKIINNQTETIMELASEKIGK